MVSLVVKSEDELPVSLAIAVIASVSAGAVVSSVTLSAPVVELLPRPSLNRAEICLTPSAPRSPTVTARLTLPAVTSAAVTVCVTGCASGEPPSNSSTVSPATTVAPSATVKLGAVTEVILSLFEVPLSEAATRSGVPPVGAVVLSV